MAGIDLIADERERQQWQEKFDDAHDDAHRSGELVNAATCYLAVAQAQAVGGPGAEPNPDVLSLWPWEAEWWKPAEEPIRNLTKAGALIAAEIDRLRRIP